MSASRRVSTAKCVPKMRNFFWCPQEAALACRGTDVHYHICITGPEGRTIYPACGQKALHLYFRDQDPEAIRRTEAYAQHPAIGEELIRQCFTEDQAKEMAAFVKATPDSDDTYVIVNCEAGLSRSPGTVLAFRRFYGGDVDEPFRKAHPNIHVASVLGKVLREQNCPDGLLPDGEVCPKCGKNRAPSGVGWGTWVHFFKQ